MTFIRCSICVIDYTTVMCHFCLCAVSDDGKTDDCCCCQLEIKASMVDETSDRRMMVSHKRRFDMLVLDCEKKECRRCVNTNQIITHVARGLSMSRVVRVKVAKMRNE